MYCNSPPGVALTTPGWSALRRAFGVLPVDDIALCASAHLQRQTGTDVKQSCLEDNQVCLCVGVDGLLQWLGVCCAIDLSPPCQTPVVCFFITR